MSVDNFKKIVDELVEFSDGDQELKEGLAYLDKKAQEKGISIYEMVFEVLYKHDMNEKASDWLKKRN